LVPLFDTSPNNAVIIPGNDDFIIRRIRAYSTWPEGVTGSPTFSLRLPNGFSVSGGDLLPLGGAVAPPAFDGLFEWLPFMPSIPTRAGERLILDVGSMNAAGPGNTSITTVFEFEGVRRRRI
jgi:hypothetical protein